MSKIALKSFSLEQLLTDLAFKKDLLLFDKVLIDSGNLSATKGICETLLFKEQSTINPLAKDAFKHNLNEIEYLSKIGLLEVADLTSKIELKANLSNDSKVLFIEKSVSEIQYYLDLISSLNDLSTLTNAQDTVKGLKKISDYSLRLYNVQQMDKNITNLYPILINQNEVYSNQPISKNNAIQIILNRIPVPNSSVSWEEIQDFRSNQEIKTKYYTLINWINEISKKEINVDEFEDTLNYLYNDYLTRIKLTGMKYDLSTFEIIVNASAVIFENLPRLKFSEISKSFFRFVNRKTSLMESELQIKNREIAYLYAVEKMYQ